MQTGFLGIDAGGTHCRARLISVDGQVIGRGDAGPANTRIGMEQLRLTLIDVTQQAAREAGYDATDLRRVSAGFGIAGISRAGAREELDGMDLLVGTTSFESDAAIANLGAHDGQDGAILIVGTGSGAYVRLAGAAFMIGGYGFPISDEGSGAALGLSAMRHALRALDGRTQPTPLSSAVTGRFDHTISRIIAWMDGATPRDYAAFAPLVLDCAEAGDAIALSIVEEAVLHVERFIETVFRRGAPRLALVGGLAHRYLPWLRGRTAARLSEAKSDPLDGALYLAGFRRSA